MEAQRLPTAGGSTDGRLSPGWWEPALRGGEPTFRPEWVGIVEQAVAVAAAPDALRTPDSWPDAFAVPFRPFLAGVRARLIEKGGNYLPAAHIDLQAVADSFTAVLGRRLARIAVRVMVLELDQARAADRLAGIDGRQRFTDFLRRWSGPDQLARLFTEYPVLARLLGTASLAASEAGAELLARFAADRVAIVKGLLKGRNPGPIVSIEPGLGDPHRHGRSVSAVSFADGRQVIYKPRSQDAYLLFREVVCWLNQRVPGAQLCAASIVARPGYGWMEYIESRPLARASGAREFYRREGVLLAALYAMHAADIHCENIVASGDQPVLVDVETLFHPTMPVPQTTIVDPAVQALNASVLRASMLPNVTVGESGVLDRSGMGGDPGQPLPDAVLDWDPPATDTMALVHRAGTFPGARNRLRLDGRIIEPTGHTTAVLEGFRLGYDAIAAGRSSFTRLIESGAGMESRVIVRPSSGYARLLDESTHPSLMRDARDRDAALDVLTQASAHHPLWRQLAEHELADLWAGDIPLISGCPAARDIWTSSGHLPDLLEVAGLRDALDKVAAMNEVDRCDQEWIISASMATRRPDSGHHGAPPLREPVSAIAAEPGRLLAAACSLADQILARAMTGMGEQAGHRVNWVGLQLVEDSRWMVLPMGACLADGYLGVALFLAQLAHLTGIDRYAEIARHAVSVLPQLLGALAGQPDLLSAVGCGGMEGLGGISYGIARIATLLGDAEIRAWACSAVELASAAADQPTAPPGWAAGLAGCLAAMTAVGAELDSAAAASTARACADRLSDLVDRTDGRCAPAGEAISPGFAAGPAGIGWALARFALADGGVRYSRSGRLAIRRGGEPVIPASGHGPAGWCRGPAGLLIARTCLMEDTGAAGLRSALALLSERPVLSDLSLCHGELGIAESLIVLADAIGDSEATRAHRHRAGLILGALNRDARNCGTPDGTPTPGLLNGLAGIGYGLLRLGFADRVPSALLLEPSPRAASDTSRPT